MTEPESDAFKSAVSDALDRRRAAMTATIRVVRSHTDTLLESTARTMAFPMLYAQWEGYVREVFALYLEHLEARKIPQRVVRKHLLAYAWSPTFKSLRSDEGLQARVELIRRFAALADSPLVFSQKEKEVATKSNLNFDRFRELCECLCLDAVTVEQCRHKLNGLVHRRNNIAHGGREPTITLVEVTDAHELVLELMEAVENMLGRAIDERLFEDVA